MTASRDLAGLTALALLTASLLSLPAAALDQDDLHTGADAPNDPAGAVDVPLAGGTGLLAPETNDFDDWYRMPSVPDKGLRIRLQSATGGLNLGVMNDDLQWIWNGGCGGFGPMSEGGGCKGGGPGPGTGIEVYAHAWGGAYRIGVWGGGGGAYALDVEIVDLYDLRIDQVSVRSRPITTEAAGELPLATQRAIDVTVTNLGPGPAVWSGVNVWAQHDVGRGRDVGNAGLPHLPAGATTTVSIPWDTTGQVGDVRLDVHVGGALERAHENNHAEVREHVVVGNAGLGADLLSNGVGSCDGAGCFDASTGYTPWGKGVWAGTWKHDGSEGTWAHVGTHPGATHAYAERHDEAGRVVVDVGPNGWLRAYHCPAGAPREECVGIGA